MRPKLRVAVLQVIAKFGWGELVPRSFEPFIAQLAALAQVVEPLLATLQALRRLDLRDALSHMVASFDGEIDALREVAADDNWGAAGVRCPLAGALMFLEDPRGDVVMEPALTRLQHPLTLSQRLKLVRAIAMGYSFSTIPRAIDATDRLCEAWPDLTDNFGTDSHYCLSVVEFVDAIVVGLSEARLGRGAP